MTWSRSLLLALIAAVLFVGPAPVEAAKSPEDKCRQNRIKAVDRFAGKMIGAWAKTAKSGPARNRLAKEEATVGAFRAAWDKETACDGADADEIVSLVNVELLGSTASAISAGSTGPGSLPGKLSFKLIKEFGKVVKAELKILKKQAADPAADVTAQRDKARGKLTTKMDKLTGKFVAKGVLYDGPDADALGDIATTFQTRIGRAIRAFGNTAAPVADAGPDLFGRLDTSVIVDGTGSFDDDGDQLTFVWSVLGSPVGASPQLTDDGEGRTRLVGDVEGDYELQLAVDDGEAQATDTVTVTLDADGDGQLAANDDDRDGDRVPNATDAFPDDPGEFLDSDSNGTGNFAQADEDGDGTDDIDDAFPFDAGRSALPTIAETEFNDNPNAADPVGGSYPFRLTGAIQQDVDSDYYRFDGTAGDVITAVLRADAPAFQPTFQFARSSGSGLQSFAINASPNSGFEAHVSVVLPADGEFLLIVGERDSLGDPSFTYTIDVFADMDFDAVSDERERAVGSHENIADGDSDSLFDAAEMNGPFDVDGDGIPNWLDTDSDGDGIDDRLDGTDDPDGDDLGNFVDLDSDENSVPDATEVGPNPTRPLDTDGDGRADFRDADDDGDGLLDVNDAARLEPIETADIFDPAGPVLITDASARTPSGETLRGVARVGDTLHIQGFGFDANPGGNQLLFETSGPPVNTFALTSTVNVVTVDVPEDATGRFAIVTGGERTNWFDMPVVAATDPVLLHVDAASVRRSTTQFLHGENLVSSMTVSFNGVQANATRQFDGSLRVVVPSSATSGPVMAVGPTGTTNSVFFRVQDDVFGEIQLPPDSTAAFSEFQVGTVTGGIEVPDAGGGFNVLVDTDGCDYIYALHTAPGSDAPRLALMAPCDPGGGFVVLDASSTALGLVAQSILLSTQVETDAVDAALGRIATLPSVEDFAAALEIAMAADPAVVSKLPKKLDKKLDVALADARADVAEFIAELNAVGPVPKGFIDVDPPQSDISVFSIQGSTDIGVKNDQALFVSTKITLKDTGAVVYRHTNGVFDPNMVGPQGGSFFRTVFFVANEKTDYKQPGGRDCTVELITSGIAGGGPYPFEKQLWRIHLDLQLRGMLDRFVFPAISEVLGGFDVHAVWNILLAHVPNALPKILEHIEKDEVGAAALVVLDPLFAELQSTLEGSPGPIVTAIFKHLYGEDLAEHVIEALIKQYAPMLIPGINKIIALYKAIGLGVPAAAFIASQRATPGKLTFEVSFPLSVDEVQPTKIKRDSRPALISILGSGFSPTTQPGLFGTFEQHAKVVFTDLGGVARAVQVDPITITDEGQRIICNVPGRFRDEAGGPIRVTVLHRRTVLDAPQDIEIVDDLEITSLSPNEGGSNQQVVIFGVGFDPVASRNTVTFQGESGRLNATITSASETSLTVRTPGGVETGPVIVSVDGEDSNALTYTVNTTGVAFEFGDNGAANDDTFALWVNGVHVHSMQSPTRNAGPIVLDLSEGTHDVSLRGITAPDAIGTYFIRVTGATITGDATSGSDLTAGVIKRYTITVGGTASKRKAEFVEQPVPILWDE